MGFLLPCGTAECHMFTSSSGWLTQENAKFSLFLLLAEAPIWIQVDNAKWSSWIHVFYVCAFRLIFYIYICIWQALPAVANTQNSFVFIFKNKRKYLGVSGSNTAVDLDHRSDIKPCGFLCIFITFITLQAVCRQWVHLIWIKSTQRLWISFVLCLLSGMSCASYLRLFFSCDIYSRICGLKPRIPPPHRPCSLYCYHRHLFFYGSQWKTSRWGPVRSHSQFTDSVFTGKRSDSDIGELRSARSVTAYSLTEIYCEVLITITCANTILRKRKLWWDFSYRFCISGQLEKQACMCDDNFPHSSTSVLDNRAEEAPVKAHSVTARSSWLLLPAGCLY